MLFRSIEDKLEIGFENAAWLRAISDSDQSDIKIFDRNPYITVDSIVKRLCGYENIEWRWLKNNDSITIKGIKIKVESNYTVSITNNSQSSFLIKNNSFTEIKEDNNRFEFGPNNIVLTPAQKFEQEIIGDKSSWFSFHFDNNNILMFSYNVAD